METQEPVQVIRAELERVRLQLARREGQAEALRAVLALMKVADTPREEGKK